MSNEPVPAYHSTWHYLYTISYYVLFALLVVAATSIVVAAVQDGEVWIGAGAGGMLLLAVWSFVRMVLPIQRVWMDARGLCLSQSSTETVIPWSQVIAIERPWWGFNPVPPIRTIEVRNRRRPILFVADLKRQEQARRYAKSSGARIEW